MAVSCRGHLLLHFHADDAGLSVDVRLEGDDVEHRPARTRVQRNTLVRDRRAAVGEAHS